MPHTHTYTHTTLTQVCVRTMSKCDAITPLMAAMRRRGDIIHTCAETVKKLFELCPAELVVQVTVNPISSALVRVNFGVYVYVLSSETLLV